MRAVDRAHYVTDKAKAYSPVPQYVQRVPAYRDGHAKPGCCSHTKQGLAVLAPHVVRVPQRQHRHPVVLTYSDP
jgi:hypothetical protein